MKSIPARACPGGSWRDDRDDSFSDMRKVILWVGMSLDGYTSGVNEQLDWLVPHATRPEADKVSHPAARLDVLLPQSVEKRALVPNSSDVDPGTVGHDAGQLNLA